ncbi:MAG: tRNA 2-thiouridine(34) synthase MnmA [Patescibacteria group bacterium]
MDTKKQKKVYVAMSGGVDSSVAAVLLKEQGYFVVGVFMKFWSPSAEATGDKSPKSRGQSPWATVPNPAVPGCIWKEERRDALRVAAKLGVPLLTWDFTKEYGEKVATYMLEAYKAGITPNPDIMCNKEIKFGLFFDKAMAEGADYVATGHYARINVINGQQTNGQQIHNPHPNLLPEGEGTPSPGVTGEGRGEDNDIRCSSLGGSSFIYELCQAVDKNKDQSYFLYTLKQRHLERTLFPIGDYTKPEVRELAKKFDLPTAEKKDSQGVCFIGPLKMKSFLKDYIKPKKGLVKRIDGRTLGEHDGAWYYTIGQRHGFDIKDGGGPYYIIGKDVKKNEIYVGDKDDLYSDEAKVSNVHWIGEVPKLPIKVGVKIRYRSPAEPAMVYGSQLEASNNISSSLDTSISPNFDLTIRFDLPIRAITPGQAAVFYDREVVLGGGTISSSPLTGKN